MAAGLKVWRASQWVGVLRMGSVKVLAGMGERTGLPMGRVNGPICQDWAATGEGGEEDGQ